MPRGRAGLTMISAERVRRAQGMQAAWWCAQFFNVNERTWRRWCKTGLPLHYGAANIDAEQWDRFERRNQLDLFKPPVQSTARTPVDRHLSVRSSGRASIKTWPRRSRL